MYFWDIHSLKGELTNERLRAGEGLKYLIAWIVIYMTSFSDGAKEPALSSWLTGIIWTFAFVAGSIYCFRKNGGELGEDFLARYLAITWVITVRLSAVILLWVVPVGLLSPRLVDRLGRQRFEIFLLPLSLVITALFFWRVGNHIGAIAAAHPNNAAPPDRGVETAGVQSSGPMPRGG